jgi:hypothetical protein
MDWLGSATIHVDLLIDGKRLRCHHFYAINLRSNMPSFWGRGGEGESERTSKWARERDGGICTRNNDLFSGRSYHSEPYTPG